MKSNVLMRPWKRLSDTPPDSRQAESRPCNEHRHCRQYPTGKTRDRNTGLRWVPIMVAITALLAWTARLRSISEIQEVLLTQLTESAMESMCKTDPAWNNNILWRNSVQNPTLCIPEDDVEQQFFSQPRFGLQQLTKSLQLATACGSYCAYHIDTLATRRRGPITGWNLINANTDGTIGCWKPIYDMEVDGCFRWYKEWTNWIQDNKRVLPEPPCPECDAERANAVERISKNIGRQCHDESSWKTNTFWRNSVEDPVLCPNSSVRKPDKYLKLDEEELLDSLATRTPCGSHCIFHRHSIPREAVPGLYGSKVDKKGWRLVDLDGNGVKGCFEPIEDVKASSCKNEYKPWDLWMKTSSKVVPTSSCPKCDQLELPFGRYMWDDQLAKTVHIPPSSNASTVCGPRILIVGAMKCGTNTIGSLLLNHPRVKINGCKFWKDPYCNMTYYTGDTRYLPHNAWEIHAMSHSYVSDPVNWKGKYAQKLPYTDGFNGLGEVTFDKSPSYFNSGIFPGVAARAKRLLPNAKVVVSLCNPAERLFSEFMHTWHDEFGGRQFELDFYADQGVAPPSNFSAFIEMMKPETDICKSKPVLCQELRRLKLQTGEYHNDLKTWRDEFGYENVVVVDMAESSKVKARKILNVASDCLPIEEYPWSELNETSVAFANEKYKGRKSGHADHGEAMKWLFDYFTPHNQALAEAIDAEWPLAWNTKASE